MNKFVKHKSDKHHLQKAEIGRRKMAFCRKLYTIDSLIATFVALRITMFRIAVITLFLSLSVLVYGQSQEDQLEQLRNDVEELAGKKYKGREAGTKEEKAAAKYIAKRFKDIGLKPMDAKGTYLQEFDLPKSKDPHSGQESAETLDGVNVIGFIDNGAKSFVVIGAHFDHLGMGGEGSGSLVEEEDIHNGADDNASGVATMMNIAQKLTESKSKKNNYIFVAFTGEEKGLYGSNNFLKHPPNYKGLMIYLNNMNYMINLDMVGRLDTSKGLSINGVGTSPIWKTVLEKADTKNIKLHTTESGVGASDHTSFYLKDIPAIHFFTGSHEDYHKPSDDAEKLNYEGMIDISDMVIVMIDELNSKLKLAFTRTKDDEGGKSSRMSLKVTLGVIPDYLYDEGNGMRIEGVRDDKPAAKAGLLSGDIVTQIGEIPITGMRSYMEALQTLDEGAVEKVKVLRGDEEIEFDVQF